MKILILFVALICSSNIVLADEVVIDGSSTASAKSSLSKMIKSLSDDERNNLAVAVLRIQFSEVQSAYEVVGNKELQSFNYEIVGPKIDGLNFEEILKLADESPTKAKISE